MRNFAFISTMGLVPWGGSEYLWHGTARNLIRRGIRIHTRTPLWRPVPAPVAALAAEGADASFALRTPTLAQRLIRRLRPQWADAAWRGQALRWISSIQPAGVLVSCGSLRDDFSQLADLRASGIPYAVVIHGAAPQTWPNDGSLKHISDVLLGARRVFFVSRYGREDVQQCIGTVIEQAELIWNPLNIMGELEDATQFPSAGEGLRMACPARLSVETKGQDLLLRTLALPKWRNRDISLSIYGEGPQCQVLKNAAKYLQVHKVSFQGHAPDVRQIWRDHHLGILASRYEGMPLSLTEAMALGRANVVTRVGGVDELVVDNENGFIADAPTVAALDEALERAWSRRDELRSMGQLAAHRIRQVMPRDPCHELAERLLAIFGVRVAESASAGLRV
jgi:glycosyltransferase involved in cell wall biosynthesis